MMAPNNSQVYKLIYVNSNYNSGQAFITIKKQRHRQLTGCVAVFSILSQYFSKTDWAAPLH